MEQLQSEYFVVSVRQETLGMRIAQWHLWLCNLCQDEFLVCPWRSNLNLLNGAGWNLKAFLWAFPFASENNCLRKTFQETHPHTHRFANKEGKINSACNEVLRSCFALSHIQQSQLVIIHIYLIHCRSLLRPASNRTMSNIQHQEDCSCWKAIVSCKIINELSLFRQNFKMLKSSRQRDVQWSDMVRSHHPHCRTSWRGPWASFAIEMQHFQKRHWPSWCSHPPQIKHCPQPSQPHTKPQNRSHCIVSVWK